MSQYFLFREGKPAVPLTSEEICEWIQDDLLRFDDYIWTQGWAHWRRVDEEFLQYRPTPPAGEILTVENVEILASASKGASSSSRADPAALASEGKIPYPVAAWFCTEAEYQRSAAIAIAIRLAKHRAGDLPYSLFLDELQCQGLTASQVFDVMFLLQQRGVLEDGKYSVVRLTEYGTDHSTDELIAAVTEPAFNRHDIAAVQELAAANAPLGM